MRRILIISSQYGTSHTHTRPVCLVLEKNKQNERYYSNIFKRIRFVIEHVQMTSVTYCRVDVGTVTLRLLAGWETLPKFHLQAENG